MERPAVGNNTKRQKEEREKEEMMRPTFIGGEIPAPVTLIAMYIFVRLLADIVPEFAPKSGTALKQGSWASVANVGCSWLFCVVLIRYQFVENKTIIR